MCDLFAVCAANAAYLKNKVFVAAHMRGEHAQNAQLELSSSENSANSANCAKQSKKIKITKLGAENPNAKSSQNQQLSSPDYCYFAKSRAPFMKNK